jgi:hypothetical protein
MLPKKAPTPAAAGMDTLVSQYICVKHTLKDKRVRPNQRLGLLMRGGCAPGRSAQSD